MLPDFAEADDVAQETFVRLSRTDLAGDDPRQVLAWIYRTSTRLAVDRLRERSRIAGSEVEEAALAQLGSSGPGGEDAVATRQALTLLARRLRPAELEVALLFRIDGLNQPEIAHVLGMSERTVRRWLRRLEARVARMRSEFLP
jgi:RNA polymerase sigma-70 factor (ECF subfamily)